MTTVVAFKRVQEEPTIVQKPATTVTDSTALIDEIIVYSAVQFWAWVVMPQLIAASIVLSALRRGD